MTTDPWDGTERRMCPDPERLCPFSRKEWEQRMTDLEKISAASRDMGRWVIGLAVVVGLSVGGGIYTAIAGRVAVLELNGSPAIRERVSRNETRIQNISETLVELKDGQRQILVKLDALHSNGSLR